MIGYQTPKNQFYIQDPSQETEGSCVEKLNFNFSQIETHWDFQLTARAGESISSGMPVYVSLVSGTGTVSPVLDSEILTGSGTLFSSEIPVGGSILITGSPYLYEVVEISSNEIVILHRPYLNSSGSGLSFKILETRKARWIDNGLYNYQAVGFSLNSANAGELVKIKTRGLMRGFTGLVQHEPYCLSRTPGEMVRKRFAGMVNHQPLGFALSESMFLVLPLPPVILGPPTE